VIRSETVSRSGLLWILSHSLKEQVPIGRRPRRREIGDIHRNSTLRHQLVMRLRLRADSQLCRRSAGCGFPRARTGSRAPARCTWFDTSRQMSSVVVGLMRRQAGANPKPRRLLGKRGAPHRRQLEGLSISQKRADGFRRPEAHARLDFHGFRNAALQGSGIG